MQEPVSTRIIEKWLTGWSLSRSLPPPVPCRSGFTVEVGEEHQERRYVFPALNDDLTRLADEIVTPWTFLKVCTGIGEMQKLVPKRWVVQPQAYMMTCVGPMTGRRDPLPAAYRWQAREYNVTHHVKILCNDGAVAGEGRVVIVDDLAIYDRISTDPGHRRKGLATALMRMLEEKATALGIQKGILVATEEGRSLYTSLGWKLYSLYTSAVIPGR